MRLTQYTDYALRVLIYLGLQGEARVTIQNVAQAYGVSQNHLMKVVQQLAGLGYIHSTRGKHGGISLASPPRRIKVGAVVRDMEQSFVIVECFSQDGRCPIKGVCALQGVLSEALDAFLRVLDRYSLADIIENRDELAGALHLPTPGKATG
jgi:Rrf2 family nitric oxide-sensitive transcriptional repressor